MQNASYVDGMWRKPASGLVPEEFDAKRSETIPLADGRFVKGCFFEPAEAIDPPLDSEVWCEDVAGSVVCVRSLNDEGVALALANDSHFGLTAAAMSADEARAECVANVLRAGIVWVNWCQPTYTEAPRGGYKRSGIGREPGRWGFENYLESKQTTRFASDADWGWYIK